MSTRFVRGLVTVLAATVLVACGGESQQRDDARVSACRPGADGEKPKAEGQVTNSSSKPSNFVIRVGFRDSAGNRFSEGVDTVTAVLPGETSPWNVTAVVGAAGAVRCEVISVRRSVLPGT